MHAILNTSECFLCQNREYNKESTDWAAFQGLGFSTASEGLEELASRFFQLPDTVRVHEQDLGMPAVHTDSE